MRKKGKLVLGLLLLAGVVVLLAWATRAGELVVLSPRGAIAEQQFNLLAFTALLSLVIVLPVFAMTFYIVWKYREGNKKAKYQPEWDRSRLAESLWWLIPFGLIAILAVITWVSSHSLDPYRPIKSSVRPLTVQVIALNWKWLFIYPEQRIASVNHLEFPVGTPVNFLITADAPMNSFWIPSLGGQVYAMAGMQTKLHLVANQPGTYRGSSANISGEGFAGMRFTATAGSQSSFNTWVQHAKQSKQILNLNTYNQLAKPSKNNPVAYYNTPGTSLYDTVIMKYMMPDMQADQPAATHIPKQHKEVGQ